MRAYITKQTGIIDIPVESLKSVVAVYQGVILITLVTGEQVQATKIEFKKL